MNLLSLFSQPKVKQVRSVEDLRVVKVNDLVEIELSDIHPQGIVRKIDVIENYPALILAEKRRKTNSGNMLNIYDNQLTDYVYIFTDNGKIELINPEGWTMDDDNNKKYRKMLRRGGFI